MVIYSPNGKLALADVKVYVKPEKAPAEPGQPGGPGGPDGPDGPEEVTTPEQPATGPGTNPGAGNDGDPDTCFTSEKSNQPWWSVDLGKVWDVVAVHIKACAESRK